MIKNTAYMKLKVISNLDQKFSYVTQNVDLECCICSCIYISPLEHETCHNSFCQDCILKCENCPLCRKIINQGELIPISTNFVLNLLDKCIVKCNICNIEIERSLFIHHYNNVCLRDCYMKCGEKVTIATQKEHYKTCENYQVRCRHCKTITTRKIMKDIHAEQCPEKEILCAFCEEYKKRKNYKKHIEIFCRRFPLKCECLKEFERQYFGDHCSKCPEAKIRCSGSNIGCTFKEARKDIIVHENECVYAKLSPVFIDLHKELNRLKKELEYEKKKNN